MIIFTCPLAPSSKVQGQPAAVALTRVVDPVTATANDEEPSPVIVCAVSLSPNQEGILLNTSSAVTF